MVRFDQRTRISHKLEEIARRKPTFLCVNNQFDDENIEEGCKKIDDFWENVVQESKKWNSGGNEDMMRQEEVRRNTAVSYLERVFSDACTDRRANFADGPLVRLRTASIAQRTYLLYLLPAFAMPTSGTTRC